MIENNRSKKNAAQYAIVYNKLLKMIQDGLYPEGSKFPTEPILAQQLGISRSTLRQALALLQEDGILEAKKGVGNFIRKTLNTDNVGIEKMSNPFYKSCMDLINNVKIEMEVQLSSEHIKRIFNRKTPVALAIHRYYKEDDCTRGFCFSHVPTDIDYLNSIDLNNQEEVLDFLENKIYEFGHSSMLEIRLVHVTENIKEANLGSNSEYYQMIIETISDANGNIMVYSKYYVPCDRSVFKVFRNK